MRNRNWRITVNASTCPVTDPSVWAMALGDGHWRPGSEIRLDGYTEAEARAEVRALAEAWASDDCEYTTDEVVGWYLLEEVADAPTVAMATDYVTPEGLRVYDLEPLSGELVAVAGPDGATPRELDAIDTDALPDGWRWVEGEEWEALCASHHDKVD